MAKHVHIHLGPRQTLDAEWKESLHPRKDDGKFGTGSGAADKPKSKDDVAYEKQAALYKAKSHADRLKEFGTRAGGPLKPGEKVRIAKEWQDDGDDDYDWEVATAEEKGRLDVRATDRKTGKASPGVQLVDSYMVERAEKKEGGLPEAKGSPGLKQANVAMYHKEQAYLHKEIAANHGKDTPEGKAHSAAAAAHAKAHEAEKAKESAAQPKKLALGDKTDKAGVEKAAREQGYTVNWDKQQKPAGGKLFVDRDKHGELTVWEDEGGGSSFMVGRLVGSASANWKAGTKWK